MNKYLSVILLLGIVSFTYYITSNHYINKYEAIIAKNNIEMLQKENSLRKEMSDKLEKASAKINKLESEYNDELSRIEEEFNNNSSFIIDSWVFDKTNDSPNGSNICGSTSNTCNITETKSGIILSKNDVSNTLKLARDADRVLNDLNLCKNFIRTIYESNDKHIE